VVSVQLPSSSCSLIKNLRPREIIVFTTAVGLHWERANSASAVSKGSGGEKASGPQPPSSAWARAEIWSARGWLSGGARVRGWQMPAGSPRHQ